MTMKKTKINVFSFKTIEKVVRVNLHVGHFRKHSLIKSEMFIMWR